MINIKKVQRVNSLMVPSTIPIFHFSTFIYKTIQFGTLNLYYFSIYNSCGNAIKIWQGMTVMTFLFYFLSRFTLLSFHSSISSSSFSCFSSPRWQGLSSNGVAWIERTSKGWAATRVTVWHGVAWAEWRRCGLSGPVRDERRWEQPQIPEHESLDLPDQNQHSPLEN